MRKVLSGIFWILLMISCSSQNSEAPFGENSDKSSCISLPDLLTGDITLDNAINSWNAGSFIVPDVSENTLYSVLKEDENCFRSDENFFGLL